MKPVSALVATLALSGAAIARSPLDEDDAILARQRHQAPVPPPELCLIQTAPGESRWVTEDEKWALKREGVRFFDITAHQSDRGRLETRAPTPAVFPSKLALGGTVHPLLSNLSQSLMKDHLTTFSGFHTRYYKSDYGKQSSEWLLKQVQDTISATPGVKALGISAAPFPHSWQQSSVIATIPGKTNNTVIVGAHQDSINLWLPSIMAAPGADDDGSGTVTILEAFRVLLLGLANGTKPLNTIEFHWYSAEEGGLLGSQDVFKAYAEGNRQVKAMLQQDMTGFVARTVAAGKPESVGVIMDYVDPGLTSFIKKVIVEYCDIPFTETKCGYACSDHASASKYGFPSAFVIESEFGLSDPHIHSTDDKIEYLSFSHMEQHARMTLAWAYELGFTDFSKLEKGAQEAPLSEEL